MPTNNNYDPRAGKAGSGMYGGRGRTSSGGFGSQSGGIGSTGFGSGGGFGSSGSMGSGANVSQGFGNIPQSHAGTFGTGGLMGTGFNTRTYEQGYDQFGNPQYGVVPGAAGTPGGSPYGGFGNSALGQNPYGGAGGLGSMPVMGAGTSANPNYQPVGGTYGNVSYGQGGIYNGIYNDPAYQASMMGGGYGYGPAGPQAGPGGGMATSPGYVDRRAELKARYQWDQATGTYYGPNATASGDMMATDRIGSDGQSLGGSHIPWWAIGNPSAEAYYSNRTQQLDGTYQVNPGQPQSAPQQPQSAPQQPQSAPQQQPQGFQPGPGYQPGTPYQPSYNPNGYYDPATQTDYSAGFGGGPAQQPAQPIQKQATAAAVAGGGLSNKGSAGNSRGGGWTANPTSKGGSSGSSSGSRQTVNPFETYDGPMMDGNPNLGSNLGGGQPWSGGGNFELGPGGLIPGTGNPVLDGGLYLRDGKITGSWGNEVQLSSLSPELQAQLGPLMGNGQQTATGATGLKDAKGSGWGSGDSMLLPPGMGGDYPLGSPPVNPDYQNGEWVGGGIPPGMGGGARASNFSMADPNAPMITPEFSEFLRNLQKQAPGLPKYNVGANADNSEYRAAAKARNDWFKEQEALFTGQKYQQQNGWGSPSVNPFETYEGPMMDGNPNLGSNLGEGKIPGRPQVIGHRGPGSFEGPGQKGVEEYNAMIAAAQAAQNQWDQTYGGKTPEQYAQTMQQWNPFGAVTRPEMTVVGDTAQGWKPPNGYKLPAGAMF